VRSATFAWVEAVERLQAGWNLARIEQLELDVTQQALGEQA
jgi:hypothetical protein